MNDFVKSFHISEGFFGRYEKLIKDVVIPYQEKVLNDEIPDAEKSHAIDNFRAAAKVLEEGSCDDEFYGMVFQDSDVAKWLEACAYSLVHNKDEELEKRCDAVIDLIGRASHEDGYLNTYFTVKEPKRRWTNLLEAHELYCAGHMIEAAVAYAECTGKTELLHIMCGMADHIYKHFIEEGAKGYPGHPEIELALMRLYRYTRNEKYKELAIHFIDVRGVDSNYFIHESKMRDWTVWGSQGNDKEYAQNHLPVREQADAVGHAVRAVYLYTGMADAAQETKDEGLIQACKALWESITQRRMYVTGAIGSAYEGEAFTKDYHLPNDTAYAETCAAIGLIFFARKMIDLEKNGKYADILERSLYNGVLAGMQLDGSRFFYVNPLESLPGISGEAVTHHHALPTRPKWFACACCPPNVARLISSIGAYAWSQEEDTIYSHLFIGGTLNLLKPLNGKIQVETNYPYEDTVVYRFEPEGKSINITFAIRLPQWSEATFITLNGRKADCKYENGYAYLTKEFMAEDEIAVRFDMGIKRIFASGKVSADSGRAAFLRGPLVYCAEGTDNEGDVLSLRVKEEGKIMEKRSEKLGEIMEIVAEGYQCTTSESLYSFERPKLMPANITLIPYYTWGNRGVNQMRVWIPEVK
jgi:DUF1680 family protein